MQKYQEIQGSVIKLCKILPTSVYNAEPFNILDSSKLAEWFPPS